MPIVNLSDTELAEKEKRVLSFGLEHSFVDKNKNIKPFLAANLENVAVTVANTIKGDEKENFHEFLRAYTDIFSKNVYNTKDYTYHNLKSLIRNENVVLVPGEKKSSVVVLNKSDYISKMQGMIKKKLCL